MLVRFDELSLTAWIVQCDWLSFTAGLNKCLRYLTSLGFDLVCSEQIDLFFNYFCTWITLYCNNFVYIYDFVTS
jgi:hypothetical protein